ncbi:MAG: DUF2505 domain-containing protein [Deltaproteobacteria bacterium]|nr:DUF2505 domain-containing protein [Deltaproteobacteria bacterium]
MAQKKERTFRFDASPDRLLAVLTDPAFQEAREKAQGAVGAVVKDVKRTATEHVYELDTTEYAKTLTGVDRSKTEKTWSRYEWDLARMRCTWHWEGPHGKKAATWGNLRISPAGGGSQLEADFNIEVKVPLIGGKIEKLVIQEVDAGWVRYEKVIREWLART